MRLGHQEVDAEHLAAALLEQPEGLVPRLLARMEVPVDAVRAAIAAELERRPKVSGPAVEAGKIYVTQRFQQALVKAEDEAKRLKDEYVSVEHLWLALLDSAGRTAAARPRSSGSSASTATAPSPACRRCAATSA